MGVFSVLVPKFINETAPSELKGPFGAMSQFMITFGILVVALIGLAIPYFSFSNINDPCQIMQIDRMDPNLLTK